MQAYRLYKNNEIFKSNYKGNFYPYNMSLMGKVILKDKIEYVYSNNLKTLFKSIDKLIRNK